MAARIGSNISSIQAQRRLAESSSLVSQTYERLATGQRINKASDDAAGLAIADSLRASSALQNVAQRNINDAVSATNIVDSALAQQQNILNRLSELAEQSANGTYSDDQREALQKEYRALVNEMNRVSAATSFNGVELLAGKRAGNQSQMVIQAGVESGQDSLLSLGIADTGALSGTIGAQHNLADIDRINSDDSLAVREAGKAGLDALSALLGGALLATSAVDSNGREREFYLALVYGRPTGFGTKDYAFVWSLERSGENKMTLMFTQPQRLTESVALSWSDGATASVSFDLSALDIQNLNGGPVQNSSLEFTGVETPSRAEDALMTVSNRRTELSLIQSQVGAMQSRFQAALEVASTSGQNAKAAESRIRDTDIADAASTLVKAQIGRQVASSILAQANQEPALALSLLANR